MNVWVQLKDGVAFAHVESNNFVGNSILLEDNLKWEDVCAKKYQDGEWVEAPLIYFVEQTLGNKVLKVNSTVFSSDVTGPVCTEDVREMWTINEDGSYSAPANIADATIWDEQLFN